MSVWDLGLLEGDLVFFGGPYSNLQATEALRDRVHSQHATAHVICTGDVVAYCAQPNQTVQLLREWEIPVVMGNCEEALAANAEDCGCGFEEGDGLCSIVG